MAKIKLKHVNLFRNKKRKNKKLRYYFRAPGGGKAVLLPGEAGSKEFMTAYGLALKALETAKQDSIAIAAEKLAKPGTVAAWVVTYYKSDAWTVLAPDTKEARERIIRKFVEEFGAAKVATLTKENLITIMNDIASLSARRSWLKCIRHLFAGAVPSLIPVNPAEDIKQVRLPKSKGHHSWTDDEIARYRLYWKLGTVQRLVFEFALETVSRRGEVVSLGPQHCYIGTEGRRRIRIERTHGSENVDIEISDLLAAAIDAMPLPGPINGVVPLTFLHTKSGKLRSKKALGNDFAKWAKQAGLPDRCRLHGLKKGGLRQGAEAGLTTHELMGQSGHKSLAEVQRYTAAADQKKLADAPGAAKRREALAKGPKLITDRTETDQNLQTPPIQTYKHGPK